MAHEFSIPSALDVEEANMVALGTWMRFCESPRSPEERSIMERVSQRFQQGGGWTPALSKEVGWEP
jgi:hypothetical protein